MLLSGNDCYGDMQGTSDSNGHCSKSLQGMSELYFMNTILHVHVHVYMYVLIILTSLHVKTLRTLKISLYVIHDFSNIIVKT